MKHYLEKTIPEKKVKVVAFKSCDICKKPDKSDPPGIGVCNLDDVEIEFNDVEMSYPECGHGEKYTYDICEDCFKEKVMPALEALGAVPTIKKWDY